MDSFEKVINNMLAEDFSKVRKTLILIENAKKQKIISSNETDSDIHDDTGHVHDLAHGVQTLLDMSEGKSVEDVSTDDLVQAVKTYVFISKLIKKTAEHVEEAIHTMEIMKRGGHLSRKTKFDQLHYH